MANVLITGGTGSLGFHLVKKWYGKHKLTVLSRDPHKQGKLAKQFPKVTFFLTDICNYSEVYKACVGQEILIHAAALKDVGTGEYHPAEFARVNVQGAQVIADAWANTAFSVPRKALLISTDKAVNSLNTYGASKRLAEAIFRKHDFSALRYGNVVNSNGSFLDVWSDAVANDKPIVVREPFPTRFFLTLEGAFSLVENTLDEMVYRNGIFVPNCLSAFSVKEVAEEIANSAQCTIEFEDLLPYEKVDEVLLADGEVAYQLNNKLSVVYSGWEKQTEHKVFNSKTTDRIDAKSFLEFVGWKL